jgi:hypothetical protein
MTANPPTRPRISTTDAVSDPRTSDDAETPRALWNPSLQDERQGMDYLSPAMAPRSGSSNKGKGRAQDDEPVREGQGYGYEEPEYLTVRRSNSRTRSTNGQHRERDGYEEGDLEMGVGNRNGVGVGELEGGAGAYPPVSEEDAEERRIKDVSLGFPDSFRGRLVADLHDPP